MSQVHIRVCLATTTFVNLEKNGGRYQILIGKSMKCNK